MIALAVGDLLSECGAMQQAEQQYVVAAASLMHNPTPRLRLAHHYLKTGRAEEAVRSFQEALRLAPDALGAHVGLASALAALGKLAEARAVYVERLRTRANRVDVLMAFALFLAQTGELKEAEERGREALRMAPRDVAVLGFLGDLALKEMNVDEAIEHYVAATQIWADWPGLRAQLDKARTLQKRRKQESP